MRLLTVNNAKTVKGEKLGWRTGVLYLAPHTLSGHNVCPWSTACCRQVCLYTAGRGAFSTVQAVRLARTKWLFDDRQAFISKLCEDIEDLRNNSRRAGLRPCIRLNGTSDIRWWTPAYGCIPQRFPDIRFYGYTKDTGLGIDPDVLPSNWYTMLSYTGRNTESCRLALSRGINVSVVFKSKVPVGRRFLDHKIIDGDTHDLRFLDKRPRVVGLLAKGLARAADNIMIVGPGHQDLS